MFAENRRLERSEDLLDTLEEKGFEISNIMDYTSAEDDDYFLEGRGSMLLDRKCKSISSAHQSLTHKQIEKLEKHAEIRGNS